jgi:flagellin
MTRINTNMSAVLAALYMDRNNTAMNTTMEQLSTGLKINSAGDDPSGVIAVGTLGGQISGVNDALSNAQQASNMMATADSSMSGISSLLLQVQQLVSSAANSAGQTTAQLTADQNQLDTLVASINQQAGAANFNGQNLLDGSLDYKTSGLNAAQVSQLSISTAPVGTTAGPIPVKVQLTQSATQAALFFPAATVTGPVTVNFTGPTGSQTLTFAAGTTKAQVLAAINGTTSSTGLTASYVAGNPANAVEINTSAYGSAATESATVTTGNPADFALQNSVGAAATTASGTDIAALVNGQATTGAGLTLNYAGGTLDFNLTAQAAFNAAGPGATTTFNITSGGALFQLGSQIGAAQQVSVGIPSLKASALGDSVTGFLSSLTTGGANSLSSGNLQQAMSIVTEAETQVSSAQARVGSFQSDTLSTLTSSLNTSLTSLTSAQGAIQDTDYAVATAALSSEQVLEQAVTSVMALANQEPSYVLQLLK